MTFIILLSINSGKRYKSFEHLSFCICTDQKDVPKNVYEVDQELGVGYCLFLRVRVRRKDRGVPGGHGYK